MILRRMKNGGKQREDRPVFYLSWKKIGKKEKRVGGCFLPEPTNFYVSKMEKKCGGMQIYYFTPTHFFLFYVVKYEMKKKYIYIVSPY